MKLGIIFVIILISVSLVTAELTEEQKKEKELEKFIVSLANKPQNAGNNPQLYEKAIAENSNLMNEHPKAFESYAQSKGVKFDMVGKFAGYDSKTGEFTAKDQSGNPTTFKLETLKKIKNLRGAKINAQGILELTLKGKGGDYGVTIFKGNIKESGKYLSMDQATFSVSGIPGLFSLPSQGCAKSNYCSIKFTNKGFEIQTRGDHNRPSTPIKLPWGDQLLDGTLRVDMRGVYQEVEVVKSAQYKYKQGVIITAKNGFPIGKYYDSTFLHEGIEFKGFEPEESTMIIHPFTDLRVTLLPKAKSNFIHIEVSRHSFEEHLMNEVVFYKGIKEFSTFSGGSKGEMAEIFQGMKSFAHYSRIGTEFESGVKVRYDYRKFNFNDKGDGSVTSITQCDLGRCKQVSQWQQFIGWINPKKAVKSYFGEDLPEGFKNLRLSEFRLVSDEQVKEYCKEEALGCSADSWVIASHTPRLYSDNTISNPMDTIFHELLHVKDKQDKRFHKRWESLVKEINNKGFYWRDYATLPDEHITTNLAGANFDEGFISDIDENDDLIYAVTFACGEGLMVDQSRCITLGAKAHCSKNLKGRAGELCGLASYYGGIPGKKG